MARPLPATLSLSRPDTALLGEFLVGALEEAKGTEFGQLESLDSIEHRAVEHLEPFGVPADDVRIILNEVPRENVGMRGGKAAVDIELGYEVKI